jgi:hypothetical protein
MENKADNLCGGHMWISAYTNFQQQSQSPWGCRVQTKYYPEGTRAWVAQCTRYGPVLILCAEIRRAGDKLEWSWKRGRSFSRAGQFHLKVGVRLRGGQRKGGWQAGDASAQVDIGIEAERRF